MGLFRLFGGGSGGGDSENGAETAEAALSRLEAKTDALLRGMNMEPEAVGATGGRTASRLAVLERKIDRALASLGSPSSGVGAVPYGVGSEPSWMVEVEAEIRANRLINAIKIYRDYTGQGLRESKDAVDTLHAELRRRGEVRR